MATLRLGARKESAHRERRRERCRRPLHWTRRRPAPRPDSIPPRRKRSAGASRPRRSEEHTSELQSLMRTSYAVFCLKKKKQQTNKLCTEYKKQRNKTEE